VTGDTGALPAEIESLILAELQKRVKERDGATRALFSGKPACAGIERRKPAGRLSVRPAPTAGDAISRMVEAGIVTWDGRVALPEAGESA
jgi:hypothetical protein